MKSLLFNIIVILIIILCYIGIKDYEIYKYVPYPISIEEKEKVSIINNSQITNYTIENLNFYIDDSYRTTDFGETFTKESSDNRNMVIHLEVMHNIIKNVCIKDAKLGSVDYIDLMKYSKLNTENDLIQYYLNHKNQELDRFKDLIYQIRTLYLTSAFVEELNLTGNIHFLDGLDGYMNEKEEETIVGLFHNGNMYKITFSANIDRNAITNFLNSIYFD